MAIKDVCITDGQRSGTWGADAGYCATNIPLSSAWLIIQPSRSQTFLEKLKQARLDAGLTQVDVAQMLGKHQSYISKCESGERRVDFVELLDFAAIYNFSFAKIE